MLLTGTKEESGLNIVISTEHNQLFRQLYAAADAADVYKRQIYSMVKAVDIIIEKVIGHLIIISSTKVMRRIAIAIFGFILFPPPLC